MSEDFQYQMEATMHNIHNESESESGYKKKLHKKLFKSEHEVKQELLSYTRVKDEAESDVQQATSVPASPHKRKRKRERTSSPETKLDQELLETYVKQECLTAQSQSSEDCYEKSKKKKRKKEHQNSNEQIIEDKFSAEETIVEIRPETNGSTGVCLNQYEEVKEKKSKKEKKKKKKKRCGSGDYSEFNNSSVLQVSQNGNDLYETLTQDTGELDYSFINDNQETSNATINITKKTEASKVSDRIQFEDGNYLLAAGHERTDYSSGDQSTKLKQYLKANPQLHALTCNPVSNDSCISEYDDIWLFHCPYEMNIAPLKDTNISLDNKCKLKIDSQSFVGNVESEMDRAAILTFEHNKPVIKSLAVSGIVTFHKRLPKAHFMEDSVIANNQTNFIPLPDTKHRHPLFGPDYKRAIKIPTRVKDRLENPTLEAYEFIKDRKKKKKKTHEDKRASEVAAVWASSGGGGGGETRVRKRRKADAGLLDQPAEKKSKRVKHEPETETWDSEKAIEENLFNY